MKKLILAVVVASFACATAVQAGGKACQNASSACAAKCKAAELTKAKAESSMKGATKLIAKR